MKVDTIKVALTLGIVFSSVHILWSVLVALGLAQGLLDFILWAHMVSIPHEVTSFNVVQAGTLVIVTFVVGFSAGWIIGTAWNKVNK